MFDSNVNNIFLGTDGAASSRVGQILPLCVEGSIPYSAPLTNMLKLCSDGLWIISANEESEEYFLRATRQLLPVSRRIKIELENALAEKRDLFSTNLEWTSAPEVMGLG